MLQQTRSAVVFGATPGDVRMLRAVVRNIAEMPAGIDGATSMRRRDVG